jgi:hypothetical protein
VGNRFLCGLLVLVAAGGPAAGVTLEQVAGHIRADWFHNRGYTGAGIVIGNVEGGHVWDGHETLDDGRVAHKIQYERTVDPEDRDHPTAVVGTMIADSLLNDGSPTSTGPGIAYGSTVWSGQIGTKFFDGSFTISGNSLLWPLMIFGQEGLSPDGSIGGPAAQTVDVINSSWGGTNDTGNTIENVIYDYLANSRGVTAVVSSGNEGPGVVGTPVVTSWSSGGLVGSFDDPATRTKPDVVAPGSYILMPTMSGATDFSPSSGTSFSSPIVAASAALLVESGKDAGRSTDPRLVKAVLMNSAVKLAGWSQESAVHPTTGTAINYAPVDPAQGAGRVDLGRAWRQYAASSGAGGDAGTVGPTGWSVDVAGQGNSRDYLFDGGLFAGETLTATAAWFMDRRVVGFDPNKNNPYPLTSFFSDSFDDLDLLLYVADASGQPVGEPVAASISGWDPADPDGPVEGWDSVEHLYLTVPETGRYLLRVRWSGELFDDVGDADSEDFALAWMVDPLPGDVVRDGLVDGLDYVTWSNNYEPFVWGKTWEQGDMNDDGFVDGVDFVVWSNNYHEPLPAPGGGGLVPEPASGLVLVLGAAAVVRRRNR